MITEDYVSYELAKMLKEKGFDECPLYRYDDCGQLWVQGGYDKTNKWHFPAPTLQMAMTWLRKTHKLHIEFVLNQEVQNEEAEIENYYFFNVSRLDRIANEGGDCKFYKSYEEAVEAAIKYCLENLI